MVKQTAAKPGFTIDPQLAYPSRSLFETLRENVAELMQEFPGPAYITSFPSSQNLVDLFHGEWSSSFPPPFSHLQAGPIPLFQDSRLAWAIQTLGGVTGFRVLELGPLEGGHSYMLDRAGSASITAIEANPRAFVKCLLAKEILGMPRVIFRLGDFREFLAATSDTWDLCVASGVLYHMLEPVELLKKLAARTNRLFLWTHYYDETLVNENDHIKQRFGPKVLRHDGEFTYTLHQYDYLADEGSAFTGGTAHHAHWLTRTDILSALQHFGYRNFQTSSETPDHPHGPAFALLATR